MKTLFALFCGLLLTSSAWSQAPEPTAELAPGKYLLIANDTGDIQVWNCEVLKEKEGTFIQVAPPAKFPELVTKPLAVFFAPGGQVQFSWGPLDCMNAEVRKNSGTWMTVYIGQLKEGDLHGIAYRVSGNSSSQGEFRLHKL